ncbi:MAG: hypothetical protein Q9186_007535 [Xanthomendoza sp. 1 TL-2023]
MHASMSIILAASSFFLGDVAAAPAASPPNARDIARSQSVPPSTTSSTPNVDLPLVTSMPVQRRQRDEAIYQLNDIVFPQYASSSASASTSSSSSTFAFTITRPTKAAAPPAAQPAKLVERDASALRPDPEEAIRPLAALSFPQKISSSSSATASPTPTIALRPNRLPVIGAPAAGL